MLACLCGAHLAACVRVRLGPGTAVRSRAARPPTLQAPAPPKVVTIDRIPFLSRISRPAGAPGHERVHGEAHGQPPDRRAPRLRGIRGGRPADRGRAVRPAALAAVPARRDGAPVGAEAAAARVSCPAAVGRPGLPPRASPPAQRWLAPCPATTACHRARRRRPYAVILFDEVEKAHGDVFNILLQVGAAGGRRRAPGLQHGPALGATRARGAWPVPPPAQHCRQPVRRSLALPSCLPPCPALPCPAPQILDDGRVTDAQGRVVNFKNGGPPGAAPPPCGCLLAHRAALAVLAACLASAARRCPVLGDAAAAPARPPARTHSPASPACAPASPAPARSRHHPHLQHRLRHHPGERGQRRLRRDEEPGHAAGAGRGV